MNEWNRKNRIFVFLWRFVLDLSVKSTYQTRHVSLRPWPLTLDVTALVADAGVVISGENENRWLIMTKKQRGIGTKAYTNKDSGRGLGWQ